MYCTLTTICTKTLSLVLVSHPTSSCCTRVLTLCTARPRKVRAARKEQGFGNSSSSCAPAHMVLDARDQARKPRFESTAELAQRLHDSHLRLVQRGQRGRGERGCSVRRQHSHGQPRCNALARGRVALAWSTQVKHAMTGFKVCAPPSCCMPTPACPLINTTARCMRASSVPASLPPRPTRHAHVDQAL